MSLGLSPHRNISVWANSNIKQLALKVEYREHQQMIAMQKGMTGQPSLNLYGS